MEKIKLILMTIFGIISGAFFHNENLKGIEAYTQEIEINEKNIFRNPNDIDDTYMKIELNDRVYIPFGTQNKDLTDKEIGKCIAVNKNNKNQKYYEVKDSEDLIASFYDKGFVSQIDFYRALDSKDKEIFVPEFVRILNFDYWEEENIGIQ